MLKFNNLIQYALIDLRNVEIGRKGSFSLDFAIFLQKAEHKCNEA